MQIQELVKILVSTCGINFMMMYGYDYLILSTIERAFSFYIQEIHFGTNLFSICSIFQCFLYGRKIK